MKTLLGFGGPKKKDKTDAQRLETRSSPSLIKKSAPLALGKTFKKGALTKQGGNWATWKKRMFIAKRDAVFYYDIPKSIADSDVESVAESVFTEELGCIPLARATISKIDIKNRKFCFQIVPANAKRAYVLSAATEKEMNSWIDTLKPMTSPDFTDALPLSPATHMQSPQLGTPQTPRSADLSSSVNSTSSPLYQDKSRKSDADSPSIISPQTPSLGVQNGDVDLDTVTSSTDRRDSMVEVEPTGAEIMEIAKRAPILTEEEEYDIALCAAEIFLKKETDRTPEEQAYVLSLTQYYQQMKQHMKKWNCKPEYGLASGTCIFCIPASDRTEIEREFAKEISEQYFRELESDEYERFTLPVQIQAQIATRAAQIMQKPDAELTPEEKQYIAALQDSYREIARVERKFGVQCDHTLISSTTLLTKYNEELTFQDLELARETSTLL